MTALIACDLDRTLIYSATAFGTEPAERVCVEHYQGAPLSFMTVDAVRSLGELAGRAIVVPSTTRTVEQYSRIDLPGAPFRYAVTSNGGNILVDGAADEQWRARTVEAIRIGGAPLNEVVAQLQSRISDGWVHKLRVAEDLFCYLVVDEALMPADFLADWSEWCAGRGWDVSRQGRKVYAVPTALCKSSAVAEVRGRLVQEGDLTADDPLIAAGDGALDAEMLGYADAAIRPRHGELEEIGWTSPHVEVTARAGPRAAEEIVAWFARRTAPGIR